MIWTAPRSIFLPMAGLAPGNGRRFPDALPEALGWLSAGQANANWFFQLASSW
ncbi:hypothetical protein [Victivallis sp. Marseille-Q1083]|uniref:hypothetical protein n=1 Tax=Victivallis sp. Marseille-Q1083 TaxID=2717288 RepID=UPI00158DDE91|nr:hypothetical protein [Victivallis sp. Marseille-Q1083]